MSDSYINILKCPECGHSQKFEMWKTINTADNPEMKEKVRRKQNFRMVCDKCGKVINADHPFLYHEPDNQIMIYYVREDDNDTVQNELGATLPGYIRRTVNYQNDLIEKLMIFDAGLDDRVVELVKAIFINEFYKANNTANIEEVLFDASTGEMRIIMMNGGRMVAAAPMAMEVYESVEKQFGGYFAPLRRDSETVIDFEWAMGVMNSEAEKRGGVS